MTLLEDKMMLLQDKTTLLRDPTTPSAESRRGMPM
jgi:hypothetical protein